MDDSLEQRKEHLEGMRRRARDVLEKLHQQVVSADDSDAAAIGDGESEGGGRGLSYRRRYFDKHGFFHVPDFADVDAEVRPMKEQMKRWVEDLWDVEIEGRCGVDGQEQAKAAGCEEQEKEKKNKSQRLAVFRTDSGQEGAQGSNVYFLDSAAKVHFFAEKEALDGESGRLKSTFAGNKMAALNKAGHGMHMTDGIFRSYTTSAKVRSLVAELGWSDPVVPQSMYIAKQPRIGGEVTSHQDSTFLYTTPRQTCLGLWLALDESTLENGCLWIRPASHLEAVRRKFRRNPDHFGDPDRGIVGDPSKPLMIFEELGDEEGRRSSVPWEGKIPAGAWPPPSAGLFDAGFVPVECKAGDLLVFSGQLDHLSLPNYSALERHTFQLHLVEGPAAGVTWADTNWLQYPAGVPFLSIGPAT